MANEAAVVIIAKWKDEASAGLASLGNTANETAVKTAAVGSGLKTAATNVKQFGDRTDQARLPASRFRYETIALGAALNAVGNLIGRIDSPAAKMISNFLDITGTVMLTVSSITHLLPYLSSLANSLREVAIVQTVLKALSGPAGWISLGIGAVVGGAAAYGIATVTSSNNKGSNLTVNNYIAGSVRTDKEIADITRREIIKSQNRNSGISGIQ
jgi:hypothetical protein